MRIERHVHVQHECCFDNVGMAEHGDGLVRVQLPQVILAVLTIRAWTSSIISPPGAQSRAAMGIESEPQLIVFELP